MNNTDKGKIAYTLVQTKNISQVIVKINRIDDIASYYKGFYLFGFMIFKPGWFVDDGTLWSEREKVSELPKDYVESEDGRWVRYENYILIFFNNGDVERIDFESDHELQNHLSGLKDKMDKTITIKH